MIALAISMPSLRLMMLGGSAAILYVVGRLVMGTIPARIDRSILRALVATTSVLAVSIACTLMRRPDIALHLPIAAAAAALTFGVGALIAGRPLPSAAAEAAGVRSWALVLPAIAITLIGGFAGRVSPMMLIALVAYGIAALLAWLPDRPVEAAAIRRRVTGDAHAAGATATPATSTDLSTSSLAIGVAETTTATRSIHAGGGSGVFALTLWIGGVCLAAMAGALAVLGVPALDAVRQVPSDALVTVFLLAPAIVVPLVFELLPPCRPIGWSSSLSTLAKFALLNLCLILPIVILVTAGVDVVRAMRIADAVISPTTLSAVTSTGHFAPLVFPELPPLALRSDLLVLGGASLLLVPMAANGLRPGMLEALAFLICYLFGLTFTIGALFG